MPAFINIGQRLDVGEGEELKAFTTAGFLGSEYGPFSMPYPGRAADVVRPPGGMTPGRFESRDAFYRKLLDASPDRAGGQRLPARVAAARLRQRPSAAQLAGGKAFDLSLEPLDHIQKYVPGYTPGQQFRAEQDRFGAKYEQQMVGRFGLGCLLARRLVEAARATSR